MNDIERKERFFTQIMMDHKNEKLLNFLESDEIAEKGMSEIKELKKVHTAIIKSLPFVDDTHIFGELTEAKHIILCLIKSKEDEI